MSVYERLVKLQRSCWACVVIPVILLLGTWTFIIEPRWVAHREISEAVPNWQGPPGLKVAVASDWHFTKRPLQRVMTVERARAIVAQMQADEARHAQEAGEAGALDLPSPVKALMRASAKVMTTTAHYL